MSKNRKEKDKKKYYIFKNWKQQTNRVKESKSREGTILMESKYHPIHTRKLSHHKVDWQGETCPLQPLELKFYLSWLGMVYHGINAQHD